MPLTLDQTQRLEAIRIKAIANTASLDELKEAYEIMRQDRVAAATTSTASRTKAAAERAPVDTQALLAALKSKLAGPEAPPSMPSGAQPI